MGGPDSKARLALADLLRSSRARRVLLVDEVAKDAGMTTERLEEIEQALGDPPTDAEIAAVVLAIANADVSD